MKVTVSTHGGFTAGIRRPPQVVDGDLLSPEAAAELKKLVDAVRSTASAKEAPAKRVPDETSYTIVVDADGDAKALRGSESTLSAPMAALLDWVQKNAQ